MTKPQSKRAEHRRLVNTKYPSYNLEGIVLRSHYNWMSVIQKVEQESSIQNMFRLYKLID